MTPKATMNGRNGAIDDCSPALTVSQENVPVTAPDGSALVTAAMPAPTAASAAALRNRYNICALAGVPGARSRGISPGSTQPSADSVTESAKPTTVSAGVPGTPVMVTEVPRGMKPAPGQVLSSTIWLSCRGQWPIFSTTSSAGPPGTARPATVSVNGDVWPDIVALTAAVGTGPRAAVTCGSEVVAVSWASVALAGSLAA